VFPEGVRSYDPQEVLEEVKKWTVLELADFVKLVRRNSV